MSSPPSFVPSTAPTSFMGRPPGNIYCLPSSFNTAASALTVTADLFSDICPRQGKHTIGSSRHNLPIDKPIGIIAGWLEGPQSMDSTNDEAILALLRYQPITDELAVQLQQYSANLGAAIANDFKTLNGLVQRHELVIQTSWKKKRRVRREMIILKVWPTILRKHGLDYDICAKEYFLFHRFTERDLREEVLWPSLNLEDLSKTQPILVLLNSRGRNTPWTFAASELQHSPFVSVSDCSECSYFNTFTKDPNPDQYGHLCVPGDDNTGCLQADCFRECSRHALLLLKIQHRIYRFLVLFCQELLSDIFMGDQLPFLDYPILPEPPSIDFHSKNQGYATMTEFNLLAPHRGRSLIGFNKLHDHLIILLNNARDHLWSLREDPSYFMDEVKTWVQHDMIWTRDRRGERVFWLEACTAIPHFHLVRGRYAIREAYYVVGLLQVMVERLRVLKHLFRNGVVHDLHKGFDTASLFLSISRALCTFEIRRFRLDTWSAPKTRYLYMRTECCGEKHGEIIPRPQHLTDNEYELLWIFYLFEDGSQSCCHKHSFHYLSLALEKLDTLIQTDKNIRQRISPRIAERAGIISVLLESIRQLYLWLEHPEVRFFQHKCAHGSKCEKEEDPELEEISKWTQHIDDYKFPFPSFDPLSKYPIHSTPSLSNINTMRNAEQFLDGLWQSVDRFLEEKTGVAQYPFISQCLEGVMRRTPPFIAPNLQTKSTEYEYIPLSRQFHDKEKQITGSFSKLAMSDRSKEKTRGKAAVGVEEGNNDFAEVDKPADTAKKFVLRRRSYQVFKTMFGLYGADPGSCPKVVKWPEFIHAMTCVGFSIEKLQGSAWQFTPSKDNDVTRGIQFHEPHPDPDIPYSMARHFGRRLERIYGWTQDMFELE